MGGAIAGSGLQVWCTCPRQEVEESAMMRWWRCNCLSRSFTGSVYLVEPVFALYIFSMSMGFMLLQQYVYRRLWLQVSGAPYPVEVDNMYCADSSTNLTLTFQEVQRETSLFFLYYYLLVFFPGLLPSLLLVNYSDFWGRKAAILPPVVGGLFLLLTCFLTSYLSLDLNFVLGTAVVTGFFGGMETLLGACFLYMADWCEDARIRTVRMAGLEIIPGLFSGLSSLCTGYFIRTAGFTWPFLTAALLLLLNLGYVLFVLRETLNTAASPCPTSSSSSSSSTSSTRISTEADPSSISKLRVMIGHLQKVYLIFVSGSRRRNTVLGMMLAAFALHTMSQRGAFMVTLYELNEPLCWSEVLVSYGSLLTSLTCLTSFAGVFFLSRCLGEHHIVLLGLLSISVGLLMAAVAKTTLLMLLVRIPLMLSAAPSAVLRSMMSKVVLSSEQGAVFACIAFVDLLSANLAQMMFSSTYAATVAWFSGFIFLLASFLSIISAVLIGVLMLFPLDVVEDMSKLTAEE
ncbi:solute carrier family 46 member 3-like [Lampris incognitus]|uniref:solute carrier family 46 member 3-like n=1 Tax=Lampris incognitus TaxID=2546036 RepID=UPI0024B63319|nr:solute carrier family 46 member 3-like [Lampris incognitus]